MADTLDYLLTRIRQCRLCESQLLFGPRPVISASDSASLLIIGQAPGTKVHASGVPWDDASGKRLREWLGLSCDLFYDEKQVAIMPMGFCYPGKGRQGDLPPRPECAPTWHKQLLSLMPGIKLTLLIGQYAQRYYLNSPYQTLTDNVRNWQQFVCNGYLPLPHPSPRNQFWLKKNPWFEQSLLPPLRDRIRSIITR